MSSTIIDNEFYSDRNLDVYEKTVLSYLIRFHNKKLGYSFPTRKQIQEDNRISTGKLNQVLQSLEDKGYITRANNPNKGGRNNIYYIHKYLVIRNDNESLSEPHRELSKDKSTNNSSKDLKSNTELSTMSTNEMLLNNSKKFDKKLDEAQRELLNRLDTDRLMKAIADAETTGKYKTYNFTYLLGAYKKLTGAPDDKAPKVVTKYHNTFNEHYKKYDDLEARLLKSQNKMSIANNL